MVFCSNTNTNLITRHTNETQGKTEMMSSLVSWWFSVVIKKTPISCDYRNQCDTKGNRYDVLLGILVVVRSNKNNNFITTFSASGRSG